MRNEKFNVSFDSSTGFITSISNPSDPYNMNWCSGLTQWGRINTKYRVTSEFHKRFDDELHLKSFEENEDGCIAVFESGRYKIWEEHFFNDRRNIVERLTIKNITNSPLFINRDNFAVAFPFNDVYTDAEKCMTNHCNTHIWCGYNTTWINALKMGDSDINLGLVLTKGSVASYSQYNCDTNIRGYFELEADSVFLNSNESFVLEWELFWHKGKQDFLKKLQQYESYIGIEAEHYTVFSGENITFKIIPPKTEKPIVTLDGENIDVIEADNGFCVCFSPEKTGEYKFLIQCGGVKTYTEFMVKAAFSELVKRRVDFIVEKQQCLDKNSPLYGAYLIYDNKTNSMYFDFYNTDHNACRERMNMPLLIIRYLQLKNDDKVRASLDLYMEFLFREFYEEKTGEVFNNIGKTRDALRLYNSPGVMLIFAEMYFLTRDERYIDNIMRLAEKYYSVGGEKCYSNAVSVQKVMDALLLSGRKTDFERMKKLFHMHVNNVIKNGTAYPAHEVVYEQSIVSPAVKYISEMGMLCDDKEFYISNVKKHLECLDRFSGNQPSFHMNEIAIRFWDDFWFGKNKKYGDTLPHHLSCLTARGFSAFAYLTGDKEYIRRGEECIRNCLCLISDDGKGSAAYVYPHTVNGLSGEFYDEWANDQDLPLYDAMNICDLTDSFKIN